MTEETKPPAPAPAPAPAKKNPEIDIVDLEDMVKVIDYACDQGAFRGWTVLNQVNTLRDKIITFVNWAKPVIDKQNAKRVADEEAKAAKTAEASADASKTAKPAKKKMANAPGGNA